MRRFINGHMIRAMDYNDIYWKSDPCHPSDLIAAPLALCESEGLGGKDLILATIIAYEIEMRLCEFGRPGVREYGWHHATLSAFAAPIAAGRVLNLTPAQMVSAIGISASRTFCPGAVTAGKLTNMKNTVDPWAGRMGAESALLARGGFSGPEHIIDGKEGLFAVFHHVQYKGEPATFDGEALVADLPNSPKSHYRILDCGMKSFPIEALSHAPLTAMMKTVKEHNIKADDVKEIKVEVIARAADILGDPHKYRPDSKETADHSLPYCMAAGLVDGMVTPLQFKEERVLDKALIPIMDKVKVVPNEEFEALFPKFQPSRVTITTNDGKSHATRVDVAVYGKLQRQPGVVIATLGPGAANLLLPVASADPRYHQGTASRHHRADSRRLSTQPHAPVAAAARHLPADVQGGREDPTCTNAGDTIRLALDSCMERPYGVSYRDAVGARGGQAA